MRHLVLLLLLLSGCLGSIERNKIRCEVRNQINEMLDTTEMKVNVSEQVKDFVREEMEQFIAIERQRQEDRVKKILFLIGSLSLTAACVISVWERFFK